MNLERVSVCYVESRLGTQRLQFAGSLAKAMNTKLSILLPALRTGDNASREHLALAESRIQARHNLPQIEVEFTRLLPLSRNAMHVGSETNVSGAILLRCFDEATFNHDPNRCIFIPFGKGGAGQRAARYGVALAKTLGMRVVFYHTTYPRDGVTSTNPILHMCGEAVDVGQSIENLANARNVPFTTVVEMAPTVAGGIVLSALVDNASLIVMSSGRQVLKGSYVDQVSELGPVPLLVLPREVA